MISVVNTLEQLDWQGIADSLHQKGFALQSRLFDEASCQSLIDDYANPNAYRKTVVMARHRFGLGEYKYYRYPLPDSIQTLREHIYAYLAPIGNAWMNALNIDGQFPLTHEALRDECRANGQHLPTALILKYGPGGYNTLHQDLYGDVYFPLQAAIFLNEPGRDYNGGEFVLTEQTPRAQSKATVLQPKQGDMLIFTTNFRPVKSTRGFRRVAMRHGVSELTSGERHVLGIIFHDAVS